MITASYTKYGSTFASAVTEISLIVIRKSKGATGYTIYTEVNVWASATAKSSGDDPIDTNRVVYADSFASGFTALNRPISSVFDGSEFEESGDMILALETSMLNLAEWSGGTIS